MFNGFFGGATSSFPEPNLNVVKVITSGSALSALEVTESAPPERIHSSLSGGCKIPLFLEHCSNNPGIWNPALDPTKKLGSGCGKISNGTCGFRVHLVCHTAFNARFFKSIQYISATCEVGTCAQQGCGSAFILSSSFSERIRIQVQVQLNQI